MPLIWTSIIEQSQVITSNVINEIKNNMNITYDKICYTDNTTVYTSNFNTVYNSKDVSQDTSDDYGDYLSNKESVRGTYDLNIAATEYFDVEYKYFV